jgi:histone H2A
MNQEQTKPRSKKSRSKKTKAGKFDIYISRVLKQVHPDCSISANTKSQVDYFLNLLAVKIIEQVVSMLSGRKTVSSRDIQSAIRIILPGELAKHAISEGTKAVTKYVAGYGLKNTTGRSTKKDRSAKAGLQFSVSRVENIIRDNTNARVGEGAPVYLAAVLEYITAELLELSGNAARDNRKTIIQPRYLMMAIENDEELKKLEQTINFDVLGGGVIPNIHAVLLRTPKEKKSKKSKTPKAKKSSTSRRKRTVSRRKKRTVSRRKKRTVSRRKRSASRRKRTTSRRKRRTTSRKRKY